jgi:hypothetical protein
VSWRARFSCNNTRLLTLYPPVRPPRSKPAAQTITLKIREPDGNEIMFKVKRS